MQWLRVSEDGVGYPGAGVKGSYELPDVSMVCMHVSTCILVLYVCGICTSCMYAYFCMMHTHVVSVCTCAGVHMCCMVTIMCIFWTFAEVSINDSV